MKRFVVGLVCAAVLGVSVSPCEGQAQNLVGRWTVSPSPGTTMSFEFREDGTGTWDVVIRGNAASSGLYDFEYRLDPSQAPMTLDLFGFDRDPLVGKGLFGIIRFDGRDLIYLDFQEGRVDPDRIPVRPVDFTTTTQRLERVAQDR